MTRVLVALAVAGILLAGSLRDAGAQSIGVFPDGTVQTTRLNASDSVKFGLQGLQSGVTYFRDPVVCSGPISCSTSAPQQWVGMQVSSIRIDYTTGSTSGSGRISIKVYKSGGTPSDTGYFIIQVGNNGVTVTPHLATSANRPAGTGPYSESFTITNSGTLQDTYSFSCSGSWLTCGQVPSPVTLAGGAQTTVSMPYSVGTTVTTGTLTLTTAGTGVSDQGQYQVPIIGYNVSVTPDGNTTATRDQGTTYSETFTITNTGADNTFNLSCSQIGTLTCVSVSPSSIALTGGGPPGSATVTYTTGGAGTSRLTLTATGTGAGGGASDDGYFMVPVASYGVQVTPDGATEPTRPANTSGYSASFNVRNTGSLTDNFSFNCSGTNGVTCTSTPPAQAITTDPNGVNFTVSYNVGAVGMGTLQFTASSSHASDAGTYSVPIGTFAVAVGPDGSTTTSRAQNTGSYVDSFTVSNGGTVANTYTFSCNGSNGVLCGAVPNPITLAGNGRSQKVGMPYSVGNPGTGRLALKATGSGGASDSGWYNVPIFCTTCTISVVPDAGTLNADVNSSGSQSFGLIGLTSGQSYFREVLCDSPVINCSANVTDPFTYSGGMGITVSFQTAGTPGTGRVRLKVYQGGGPSDTGWVNVTVTSYGVVVLTQGDSTVWRPANTGGYSDSFVVKNTGSASNTYTFSCSPVGTIVCATPPGSLTLGPGLQGTVWQPYSVGGYASPSRVRLFVTGTNASANGYREVPILVYGVAVTPDGGTAATQIANSGGHSYRFGVYNGSSVSNTFTFTCTGAGLTCGTMPSPRAIARFTQDSVDIPYTTGPPGNGTLTLKASGTSATDTGYVTVPMVSYGVSMLPKGSTTPTRPTNTGGYTARFTLRNIGSASNTYSFSCTGLSGVTCGTVPGAITISPNIDSGVVMPYSVGAVGTGTLRLTATGTNSVDSGFFSVPIASYAVAVTPKGATATTRTANTGGYSEQFTITNNGSIADTFRFTCNGSGVTCGAVPGPLNVVPGTPATVSMPYSAGGVGTGTLTFTATGSTGATDNGSYNVPIVCPTCFAPATITAGLFTQDSRYALVETAVNYDSAGRTTQVSDARGKTTTYRYSGNTKNAFLTNVTRVHDASATVDLTTDITYDATGYVSSIRDEGGSFRYFFYDGFGRLTRVQNTAGTPVSAYGYRYSRTAPNWTFDPTNPSSVIDTTFLQQTPSVVSVVKTNYVDGLGRDIQRVVNDGTSSHVTATQYDLAGRVWRSWRPYSRTGTGYDQNFVTNATAFYNAYHGASNAKPYTETAYTTDALGRISQITPEYIGTTATDFQRTAYGVDAAPNNLSYLESTDEGGARTRRYSDLFGNEVKTVFGYGATEQTTTQHTYDVLGQRTHTTDPRNLVTSFGVDTRGLLINRNSPDAGVLASKFDRSRNARYTQDANQAAAGQVLFTNYDFANRALVSGLGSATYSSLDPDATSAPALETTQANWLIVRQYDTKPSTAAFPWSRFATQINPLVLSNTTGRLTAIATKSNGAWQLLAFSYDSEGEVATRYTYTEAMGGASVLTSVNTAATYTRDLRGSIIKRALTVGSKTFYHWYDYDNRGLLWKTYAATTNTKPASADVTDLYRPSGQVQSYQFAGGPVVPLHYTIRQQLDSIGNTGSTAYPFSARYLYNANGTIAEAEFYNAGSAAAQKRYRYQFPSYDALHRLKSADFSSWSGAAWTATLANDLANITYDASGNLLSLQRYRETATLIDNLTYAYPGTSNRLSQVTYAVAATAETWDVETGGFTYDANGNMLTAPAPYSVTSATYSNQNLPLTLTRAGTTTAYRYDDAGERIAKRVGTGNTEIYVREGASQLGVFTVANNGNLSSWYFNVLVADRVVGRQPQTGSRRYYHTDLLGSTRSVVQGTTVVEAYDFEPWGLFMPGRTSGSGTKETFSGKEQDAESGLDYFGARYYMPALGRWAAVDPAIGNPEWSPYAYVEDNPASQADPDGRQVEVFTTLLGSHPEATIGTVEGIVDGAKGTYHMVRHPIQTAQALGTLYAAANGDVSAQVQLAQGMAASWDETVELWNSGTEGKFRVGGRVLEAVVEGAVGGAVVGAVGKAVKGGVTLAEVTEGTLGSAVRTGTYRELAEQGAKDAHHVIQDAAVRDLPGYSRNAAPAVQLEGPSTKVGSPHYLATQVQRQAGGGTLAAERRIGYKALRAAGINKQTARAIIEKADEYFKKLGASAATCTRVPGNRC